MITVKKLFLLLALGFVPALGHAQTYSINWYKVAGGGGASAGTNGATVYSVNGTIGQPDASAPMIGGTFSVTGGFWSLVSVLQTPGAPNLTIAHSGNNVIVSWPNIGPYVLQQNSNLATKTAWATTTYTVTTNANGTNSITIPSPTGQLFFRLGP